MKKSGKGAGIIVFILFVLVLCGYGFLKGFWPLDIVAVIAAGIALRGFAQGKESGNKSFYGITALFSVIAIVCALAFIYLMW